MKTETVALDYDEQGLAIDAFIGRRTVKIVNRKDPAAGGTGVTIEWDGRFFLATAAHVMQSIDDLALLLRDDEGTLYADFISSHVDRAADIGIVELDSTTVSALHEYELVRQEDIYLERYPHRKKPLWVVGYPGKLIQRRTTADVTFLDCNRLSYETRALAKCDWPEIHPLDRQIRSSGDLFCTYDPDPSTLQKRSYLELQRAPAKPDIDTLPPHGMSGGGIWFPMSNTNPESRIWHPTAMLVGIQTSTGSKQKWLRGTRACVLLDLLRQACEE